MTPVALNHLGRTCMGLQGNRKQSLWQQQGKGQDIRDLLAPVYNWFTGGFDAADLRDARALLASLRR